MVCSTGPAVWFQKFEYAVSHWLQKTAEHVFGCVLCSPGCFSLFRAEALMDDNVMKRYSTKATEASHYIQYDQGNRCCSMGPPLSLKKKGHYFCESCFGARLWWKLL